MTDPIRTPDPVAAAQNLKHGAALIYRHYGADDRVSTAITLRQITIARGQQLLIGHDPELAIACGADGVHFRRDSNLTLPSLWRKRCPAWIITMAGLKNNRAYKGSLSLLDALFVSSIFPSQSPSSGAPIGMAQLSFICEELSTPIIALGGINQSNASEIVGTGAAGLAGISGI